MTNTLRTITASKKAVLFSSLQLLTVEQPFRYPHQNVKALAFHLLPERSPKQSPRRELQLERRRNTGREESGNSL